MLKLALGAASAVAASAHMCTYEPLQRGGVEGSGTAGAGICALTDGPCPSENAAGPASQAYFAGDEIYVRSGGGGGRRAARARVGASLATACAFVY
jgi:hypothetical protein